MLINFLADIYYMATARGPFVWDYNGDGIQNAWYRTFVSWFHSYTLNLIWLQVGTMYPNEIRDFINNDVIPLSVDKYGPPISIVKL